MPTRPSQQEPDVHIHVVNSTFNNVQHGNQYNITQTTQDHQNDRRQTINRWLDPPDPSSNHKAACSKRQPGTGNWLIEGDVFTKWKIEPGYLWLHGSPGSGKTVLSSTIVQDIIGHCSNDPNLGIAYFYFDFQSREKQLCHHLLRSLITQLSNQCDRIPDALEGLYASCEVTRRVPDLDDLATALKQIILQFSHAYIVVDALDECTERPVLLKLIQDIIGWESSSLHLLVTSRVEREIGECLTPQIWQWMDLQVHVIARDIEIHVRESLRNDSKLRKWPVKVQEEIEATLTQSAHGMFRWVACQLDSLRKCAKLSELRITLTSLPKTLDETYERILLGLDELWHNDVHKVLQWLCFSLDDVTMDEITDILAVTFTKDGHGPRFDPDERYPDPQDILTRCSSLVSVTKTWNREVLRLAHFSVKEYLLSERIRSGRASAYAVAPDAANELIAQTCMAYLLHFARVDCPDQSTVGGYPFAGYASHFWLEHVRLGGDNISDELRELVLALFAPSATDRHTPQFLTWVRFHNLDNSGIGIMMQLDRRSEDIPSPLYYASFAGLHFVVSALADQTPQSGLDFNNVNAQCGRYGNALQAASHEGHQHIVQTLLLHGADITAPGGRCGSALYAASFKGHLEIVTLLLRHGADVHVHVHAQGGRYGNPLQAASFAGHQAIVEVLLSHGANARGDVEGDGDGWYGSALYLAALQGHKEIVELLLEHGADVDSQGGQFGSALQAAAWRGHEEVVKVLLVRGADVDAQGGRYGSAVRAGECGGHAGIVKMLIGNGARADVGAGGGEYGNAMQAAIEGEEADVIDRAQAAGI